MSYVGASVHDNFLLLVYRDGNVIENYGDGGWYQQSVSGWTGASSTTNDYWQSEYSVSYSKLGVKPGQTKTLGIILSIYDSNDYGRPPGFGHFFLNTWGDLTHALVALVTYSIRTKR